MKSKFQLLIIFIIIIQLASCKKENKDTTSIINPIVKAENNRFDAVMPKATIYTYLQGKVLDETGIPIANVEISNGTTTTTTDNKGIFSFGEITLNAKYAIIKASKLNYLDGIRTFTPTPNAFNTISITLMKKNASQTISASSGGTLSFESGKIKLEFPANAIAKTDGTSYNGDVKVYARYIDPTSVNFTGTIPGMLAGLTNNNQLTGMLSHGMLSVLLEDNNGNKLDIAENSKVKVTLPAQTGNPASMPIWHFNETNGLWIEAGNATKIGTTYEFEANYFSSWNLDTYVDSYDVTVTLNNQAGQPIANQQIDIYTSDDMYVLATVFTDNNGQFTLLRAPQNMNIKIITQCGTPINKTLQATSGTATIVVNDIDITNARRYTLSGNLADCNNTVFANKYFKLVGIDNAGINFGGVTDGSGNYNLSSIMCNTVNSTTAYAVQSTVYINIGEVKIDTITITFTGNNQIKNIHFCNISTVINDSIFNSNLTYGTMTDIDGNVYKTINIGSQTWMAENLKTTRYNDGTPISTGLSDSAWLTTTNGAYAIYDNNSANNNTYGKLYNGYAVKTGKLAPAGWHVPTDAEWITLITYLGGENIAGNKMKSLVLWNTPNANATNTSGFSAIAAGYRYNGTFSNIGEYGTFWSSTEYYINGTYYAWRRKLDFNTSLASRYGNSKEYGCSIRCIMN